jgi:hypothetical protein
VNERVNTSANMAVKPSQDIQVKPTTPWIARGEHTSIQIIQRFPASFRGATRGGRGQYKNVYTSNICIYTVTPTFFHQ